jgi:two-component system, NarL family, sensor histidine kinase BarA
MKLLDHCSLKAQLIGIVLVTCATILLVNAGLFALYDLAQFRRAKENELSVLA